METELSVALYFLKFENRSFKFLKNLIIILHIANDEIYKVAKSQCDFFCIVVYTKNDKI
jgi:hypothetical protein